jgi:hypothetical protein
MGLCDIGQTREGVMSNATSIIKRTQGVSESFYTTIIALPAIMSIPWVASIAELIMMAVGTALIIRIIRVKEKGVKTQ